MFSVGDNCQRWTVLSSSNLEVLPDGENILEPCNNEYWRAPVGKTGDEAEIIIDMNCTVLLDTFSIMNGFQDFGTKKFSLFGSQNLTKPWTKLYTGELPSGSEMTEKVRFFNQNNSILYMSRILIVVRVERKII